ncbi:MAG: hypothetical protein KF858_04900 [Candidatus Sumerlaeia bacterium]|nr:hypothetical protein [Candidatus Sumerlaeia bacterium]
MADPLKIDLSFGPATLDLNTLRRWFKEAPVRTVAYRFLKVFNDHGVKNTQIQRLVPEVTLDRVTDPIALLPALTNDVLTRTAKTLGIERAWLDGVQERMYRHHGSYQNPAAFFDVVRGLEKPFVGHALRAYCMDPNLDIRKGRPQPIVLVFAEKICDWDDDGELLRFIPFTEEWDWGYPKSRLQLKATIRACHDYLGIAVVPLYQVDRKTLKDLSEGEAVPPDVPWSRDVSLEDYVFSPDESHVSKESEELEAVFSWMKRMKMEELAKASAHEEDGSP